MPLLLVASPELQVSLDPVRTEDRVPSVAFDVLAVLNMPFQQASLAIKEAWFSHEALNAFERQLLALRSAENGRATLRNMSDHAVLCVARGGNNVTMTVHAADTMQMAQTTIEVTGYASAVSEMHERLSSFEKWW